METAAIISVIGLLIAIIAIGTPLLVKWLKELRKELKEKFEADLNTLRESIENTHSQCDKIKDRQIVNETKLDMLLDDKGFDIRKVNKAIKEHMTELADNNTPSVGCINVKELYRDKE